jgi:hypothetical protein
MPAILIIVARMARNIREKSKEKESGVRCASESEPRSEQWVKGAL